MFVYVTHIGIVRDCCVSLWSSTPMFVYAVASDRDGSGLLCVCTSSMFVYVTQIGISVCLYVQYVCVCYTDRDFCVSLRPVCLCMLHRSGFLCVSTSSMFVYVTQIGISVCLYVQYVCVCDADRDCSGLLCVCLKRNGQCLDACFKTLRQC